jgi:hypothetical protein
MREQDFSKGISRLTKFFRPITDEQIEIYWEKLRNLPPGPWFKVIEDMISVKSPGGFFPTIQELVDNSVDYIEAERKEKDRREELRLLRQPSTAEQKRARSHYHKIVSILEHKARGAT